MVKPLSLKQCTSTFERAASLEALIEQGCSYIQQGYYTEGAAMLSLVRAQLVPNTSIQVHLMGILDAFLQKYTSYQRSRQALQEASIRFAEAQKEQQEHVVVFSSTLLTLFESSHAKEYEAAPHNDLFQTSPPNTDATTSLFITCFGQFEVKAFDKPLILCSSRNGQGILRYLVAQPGHHAKSDTLQTLFWPDDEPEVAQRKLHVAISSLRRSLNNGLAIAYTSVHEHDVILYKNHVYLLNPAISLRTDIDNFLHSYHLGQQESQNEQQRVAYYECACQLYTGPFLSEDLYADWSFLQRERLSQAYIMMCNVLADYYLQHKQYEDASRWATAILQENRCDEAAHRQLIQIYIAQGRRSEAYQQYQRCEQLMSEELGVKLLPETVQVFQKLFTDEPTSIKPN